MCGAVVCCCLLGGFRCGGTSNHTTPQQPAPLQQQQPPEQGLGQQTTAMKITKQSISEKDGAGSATLRPEYPEDLWHAYNLIAVGDSVRADTVRKVQTHNSTTVACGHNDCRRLKWQALDVATVCSCAPAGEEHGRHRKHQVRPQTHNLVCAGTITQTGSACFQLLANAQRVLALHAKSG